MPVHSVRLQRTTSGILKSMIVRRKHDQVEWIDAVSPTTEEVRALMDEFALDSLIADELVAPSLRNRVDARDDYFYLVLRFPAFQQPHDIVCHSVEVDFVVGRSWILTVRYDPIDPLEQFERLFEVDTELENKKFDGHAGLVFIAMLSALYRTLHDELAHIGMRIDSVEERVFEGYEREMVVELSVLSRDLLNLAQALDYHHPLLQSLETPGVTLFGYEYARHVRSMIGEYERLSAALKSNRASLNELRETNNSLLTTKQNETMKLFTILAFVMYPLTLTVGMFGMNTMHTPIVGHQYDFWIILGLMLSIALVCFAYFKYKRWL